MNIRVNGQVHNVSELDPSTPLLWALRDHLGLTGTKFGCGEGGCGACSVHLDGELVRSCVIPVSSVVGKSVVTIEGLAKDPSQRKLFDAWAANNVAQCGYCQPGQIMAASALLAKSARPAEAQAKEWMNGNLCRCGTYDRIQCAIRTAAGLPEE